MEKRTFFISVRGSVRNPGGAPSLADVTEFILFPPSNSIIPFLQTDTPTMNRPVCGLGAFRMDLDLAQTEDAHPLSPSSPAAGSDETKETSLGSQVSSTSLEDTEDVGNEKQEGEKEKDEEEEEVEEEDVEGGSNREKRAEDIFASSTGPAGPDTVETCHASKNTIQKQKKKKKKGGKSRKKREAQRRYGPPHLDRETIKRAKVRLEGACGRKFAGDGSQERGNAGVVASVGP